MLYKKYHRNFVNQFKKGAKIKYDGNYIDIVERELYFDKDRRKTRLFGKYGEICIIGNKYNWALVSPAGKLYNDISIEEDVIQKIS